jgi:hypothetical protein
MRREGKKMQRPTVNISPVERAARVAVGAGGVAGGLAVLGSGGAALVVILAILLILAGLDLVVTGALGHCPLYSRLGHVPRSMRGAT